MATPHKTALPPREGYQGTAHTPDSQPPNSGTNAIRPERERTRYVTVDLIGGGWCTIDVHAIHSFGFDGDEIFTVKMGEPHRDVYEVTHDSAVQLIDALDAESVLNDLRIGAV